MFIAILDSDLIIWKHYPLLFTHFTFCFRKSNSQIIFITHVAAHSKYRMNQKSFSKGNNEFLHVKLIVSDPGTLWNLYF